MEYLVLSAQPDNRTAALWNACLDDCDYAAHYTAPEFFLEPYFRKRNPIVVLAVAGGEVLGVVTALGDSKQLVGGEPGSPRICIRNGADIRAVSYVLAEGLVAATGASGKYISVFAWTEVPGFTAAGFRLRKFDLPLGTLVLDLSKGRDVLFRECSETRRNKIRRAIKAGVNITEMEVEREFDAYYDLYRHWCEFKQLDPLPYDLQRATFAMRGNRLILVARHEGKMVGVSTFRYRRSGIVEYASNVSRREETGIRQNDLLLWRGVEWASMKEEFRYFSMAGSHFFLQTFGGDLRVTCRYSLDRTLLRRRDLAEDATRLATRAYLTLPSPARRLVKRLIHGGGKTS